MKDPFPQPGCPGPKLQIPPSAISDGIDLYFDLFHRQPIWCFDREDLEQNQEISTELVYSILGLTARFMPKREKQRYGDHARWNIMLRVANGTVELETIESLCLLSYSAFIGMSCLTPFKRPVTDIDKMEICTLANFISASAFSCVGLPA